MAAYPPAISPHTFELAGDRAQAPQGAQSSILLCSLLFWVALFVIHTSQVALSEGSVDAPTLRWRGVLHALYFLMSLPIGWVIGATLAQPLRLRIPAILAACLLAAIGFAVAGRIVWVDLAGFESTTSAQRSILINAHYGLVLFLLWSGLCSAILYARQSRERERCLLEAQALAHETELKMLRYQINPHFLFNTLNAVSALIVTGQTLAAEQMVAKLASFFRTALKRESTAKVSLEEEIGVQLEYLGIELTRFPDRLRWSVDIEPGLGQALVPHLILQPLFENAIKHGVARTNSPVELRMTASQRDGVLLLVLANDLPPTQGVVGASGEGVGLANVVRRLAAFYGAEGRLTTHESDGRFVVELRLPFERSL